MPRSGASPAAASRGRYHAAPRSALATIAALLFLGVVTACGPHEAATIRDSASIRDVGALEGARAVASGGAVIQPAESPNADAAMAVTDSLRAELRMMSTMDTHQMTAILPTHNRLVASLLSRLKHEWPEGHPGKSERPATIDSLRADLARLPGLTAEQLGQAMPAHLERVQRILRN